jgi:3-methyladenine DNA glycosylase AlkD
MTTEVQRLDVDAEARAISATLAARRDPGYEWGMRRTVPSSQPAHATRVPEIRATAAEWRREHRDVDNDDLLRLCDALWATRWREERIVAILLLTRAKPSLTFAEWPRLVEWSRDIDNWEHVDQIAGLTGRMLAAEPHRLPDIEALAGSGSGWQRRLSLVTLIVAFQQGGNVWRAPLQAMAQRLRTDKHPLVKRAVVWAHDRLKKGGAVNG